MAGTGEQNVLLRRRQITPQNSTNTGAELLLKAKQFVQHGRAPQRPSRVLADPTRTHRTNLWTGDILVAVRFSVRGVCLAIRRALMQIQGDLIFLPEDFPVSRGPLGTLAITPSAPTPSPCRRAVVIGHERYAKQFVSCI